MELSSEPKTSRKRSRDEAAKAPSKADKYSLEGTRYGSLQKQVERMIRDRKGEGNQSNTGGSPQRRPSAQRPGMKNKKWKQKKVEEKTEDSSSHRESGEQGGTRGASDAGDSSERAAKKAKGPGSSASTPAGAKSSIAANEPVSSSAQPFVNDRTVYIQGLPFTATEEDVRQFLSEAGTIVSMRLPKWHDSSKLRGYGHVVFEDAESAEKALEMNGLYLQERYIKVERPLVPRALASGSGPTVKPPGCKTIFIKNLPYDVSEEEIRKDFMVYGPIAKIRLAVWNHTSNQKGFGYVDFKREESAEIAVKKSGSVVIRDRIISVDYETRAPKAGFKDALKSSPKRK